jgi:hypothetical protein
MLPKVKAVLVTSIAPARLKVPAPTVAAEARLLTRARPARIPTARPPKCNFIYYLLEAISIFASCEARLRFNNGLNAPGLALENRPHLVQQQARLGILLNG